MKPNLIKNKYNILRKSEKIKNLADTKNSNKTKNVKQKTYAKTERYLEITPIKNDFKDIQQQVINKSKGIKLFKQKNELTQSYNQQLTGPRPK